MIKLSKENLASLPDKHGVYRVFAYDMNGKPIPVQRFAQKDQTETIEAVTRLFRLRNKTAHYTPGNAESLKVTISELFNLWEHTYKLIRFFHSLEQLQDQKTGAHRNFLLVSDYGMPNVSDKVVRIILSYTDYVKRVVWGEK